MDEAFFKTIWKYLCAFGRWLRAQAPTARFWFVLLVLAAAAYYGSYYRHDLRFRDEGGTIALNAQRLLNGELPLRDVILNYNVVWYYPVVALFKFFGVNFILMRAYFLALSALAAVLGYFALVRAGRHPWMAFLIALLCVLVPGMIFKNYIPLLVIANSYLLMVTALTAPGSRGSWLRVIGGGLLVGITYLIRIDLGIFFNGLWLGLHLLRLFDPAVPMAKKLSSTLLGCSVTLGLVCLVHVPVLVDARHRGFDEPFVVQYTNWVHYFGRELRTQIGLPNQQFQPRRALNTGADAMPFSWNRAQLRRNAWIDFTNAQDFETKAMVLLTYLPIAAVAIVLAWTLVCLVGGARSSDPDAWRHPLAALVLIGGALTAFPQFFFFRPDAPHLSEFSPGFWVGIFGAAMLLGAHEGHFSNRLPARLLLIFLTAHASLFLARMLPDRWTGTIAARLYRTERFTAQNGVDVFVTTKDLPGLQGLCQVVAENSAPGDYLVAYPYHPAINLMTNRPTYEKDVYVDNATRTRNWDEATIRRFEKFKPKVIVLSDWAVNGHPDSRFSVWAAPTKAWIVANYKLAGSYQTDVDSFDVYLRP